jgi:hypothetical protein
MEDKRELTGEWRLKPIHKRKNIFSEFKIIGYQVMVEASTSYWSDPIYGNGGGSYSPERIGYQEATSEDLIELGIKINWF